MAQVHRSLSAFLLLSFSSTMLKPCLRKLQLRETLLLVDTELLAVPSRDVVLQFRSVRSPSRPLSRQSGRRSPAPTRPRIRGGKQAAKTQAGEPDLPGGHSCIALLQLCHGSKDLQQQNSFKQRKEKTHESTKQTITSCFRPSIAVSPARLAASSRRLGSPSTKD